MLGIPSVVSSEKYSIRDHVWRQALKSSTSPILTETSIEVNAGNIRIPFLFFEVNNDPMILLQQGKDDMDASEGRILHEQNRIGKILSGIVLTASYDMNIKDEKWVQLSYYDEPQHVIENKSITKGTSIYIGIDIGFGKGVIKHKVTQTFPTGNKPAVRQGQQGQMGFGGYKWG